MPHLPDPTFAGAVVLLVEHDEDGSFGLIVNRPTDILLTDVLEESALACPSSREHLVWDGGPMLPEPDEPEGFVLIHSPVDLADDASTCGPGLRVYPFSPARDTLALLAREAPDRLRMFMGYAAWDPGRLEQELLEDAWLLLPPDPVLIFHHPPETMWEAGFRSLGVEPRAIVPARGVH